MRPPVRFAFLFVFVACAGLLSAGIYYFQAELGLEPCPMCILQRYAFIAMGLTGLVGAIHGPRGMAPRVYAVLVTIFGLVGAGVAMRHSYLQHFPPLRETCGADLEFLLNTFSISDAFPRIFAGTGSCSKVDWTLLGLSIPEWALAWFLGLPALALWAAWARRPGRR